MHDAVQVDSRDLYASPGVSLSAILRARRYCRPALPAEELEAQRWATCPEVTPTPARLTLAPLNPSVTFRQ